MMRCQFPRLVLSLSFALVAAAHQLVGAPGPETAQVIAEDPTPPFVVAPEDLVQDQRMFEGTGGPLFLALFGDSASLATMADEKLGQPGPRFYADFIGSGLASSLQDYFTKLLKYEPSEDERHILLGKLFGNMARKRLSPYLGIQDYSLPILLQEKTGFSPQIYNGAQMGGAYHFGHIYLNKFEKFFERNPFHKKPDMIFVNFNGMDFLGNWGPQAYAVKVREFYQRLTSIAPFAKIVVTGMADPVDLLTYPDRVSVPKSPMGPITCSALYKIVRFGNDLGLQPGASAEVKVAARIKLEILRAILAKEIMSINQDRTLYPQFKGEATYVEPSTMGDISPEMIAADCIHPNTDAQRIIGQHLWDVVEGLL